MIDLSAVGLRVQTPSPLPVGTLREFTLSPASGPQVIIKAKVVWVRLEDTARRGDLGLEILEAHKDYYDLLPRILPEE